MSGGSMTANHLEHEIATFPGSPRRGRRRHRRSSATEKLLELSRGEETCHRSYYLPQGAILRYDHGQGDEQCNECQRNKSDLEMDDRMFASVHPRLVLVRPWPRRSCRRGIRSS